MALKKHGKARRKWLEGAERKADNDDLEEAVFGWINRHAQLKPLRVFEDATGEGKSFLRERRFPGESGLTLPVFEPQEALSLEKNYYVFRSL